MKQKKHSEFKNADLLQKLKEIVYAKFGRKIVSHYDCVQISIEIMESFGFRLGITTLRRFFNIDTSSSHPSNFTLNCMACYAGFKSWNEFVAKTQTQDIETQAEFNYINLLELTCNLIKMKDPEFYDLINLNTRLYSIVKNFVKSESAFLPLVAGMGFGKSTSMVKVITKIVDKKELNGYEPYYFDAAFISSINALGFDFLKFIMSLIDYNCDKKIYPNLNENKLIIIDSFDVFALKNKDLFNTLISIIEHLSIKRIKKTKIIIICRHYTYNLITKKSPNLKLFSYLKNDDSDKLFKLEKYEMILQLKQVKYLYENELFNKMRNFVVSDYYNDFIMIPAYFNIFLKFCRKYKSVPVADIEFIKEYMSKYIYNDSRIEGIQNIIDIFINEFEKNEMETFVPRSTFLNSKLVKLDIYKYMLFNGFLSEYKSINKSGKVSILVKISDERIYNYNLALNFCNEDGKILILIFDYLKKKIKNHYRRINIQKDLLKIAFVNKQYDVILNFKKILKHNQSDLLKYSYSSEFYKLLLIIAHCIRFDDMAQLELLPKFASDADWCHWYFESLIDYDFFLVFAANNYENYLKDIKNDEAMFLSNSMISYKFILENQVEKASTCINRNESIQIDFEKFHPYMVGRWLSFKLLYAFYFDEKLIPEIFSRIEYCALKYMNSSTFCHYVPALFIPCFIFFNHCGMSKLTISYWNLILKNFKNDFEKYPISEYETVPLFLSDAYYEIGDYENSIHYYEQYTDSEYAGLISIYRNVVDFKIMLIKEKYEEAYNECKYLKIKTKILKFDLLSEKLEILCEKMKKNHSPSNFLI